VRTLEHLRRLVGLGAVSFKPPEGAKSALAGNEAGRVGPEPAWRIVPASRTPYPKNEFCRIIGKLNRTAAHIILVKTKEGTLRPGMPSLMQQMYPQFDPDLPWILTCIKCGLKVRKKLGEAAATLSIECELCGTPLYTSYLDNRAVWLPAEK
jgi:hypothetical protein